MLRDCISGDQVEQFADERTITLHLFAPNPSRLSLPNHCESLRTLGSSGGLRGRREIGAPPSLTASWPDDPIPSPC